MSTATKSRPIRQYDWEVRAILDVRKTQTRRVVKGVPDWCLSGDVAAVTNGAGEWAISRLDPKPKVWPPGPKPGFACPYGQPGDELWVRETWAPSPFTQGAVVHKAGFEAADSVSVWRPSIHMPRWASRITLTVKAVRVERLQDISEADAIAEGCGSYTPAYVSGGEIVGADGVLPSDEFRDLWKSINCPDSWDANPWVWVVEFERKQ